MRLLRALGAPGHLRRRRVPDFVAFGVGEMQFGIRAAHAPNDPPSVLTWQIEVSDVDAALERCRAAALSYELERHEPRPGWRYRRLILETPSGYRLALEGQKEVADRESPDVG